MRHLIKNGFSSARRLMSDGSGNVAMMCAVAIIPLMIASGVAIDFANTNRLSAALKGAVDAAALAGAAEVTDPNIPLSPTLIAQRSTVATGTFNSSVRSLQDLQGLALTITEVPNGLRVSASASVTNYFGQLLGQPTTQLNAAAEAGLAANGNYEVAFVLDNTGSMASSDKLVTLKAAMNKFMNKLQAASSASADVRVSIVPFADIVRIDPAFASGKAWMRQASSDLSLWGGCIGDRASPYDRNGAAPDISTTATLYEGIDRNYNIFPLPPIDSGDPLNPWPNPGVACNLAKIIPPTTNFSSVYSAISAMVADGMTNLTVGLAWGLNALTPGEPFNSATAFGGSHRKILVLVTDGQNTQSRWTTDNSDMNAATQAMCDTIKSKGITIYTIGVMDEDTSLLTACATTPSHHHFAPTPSKVPDIFNMLSGEWTSVRLTK